MNARLSYNNSFLEVTNFSHWKSEVLRGNPYNTTFDLHIQSGAFYADQTVLKTFIEELEMLMRLVQE